MSVLLNKGDGTFLPAVDSPTGTPAFWLAAGDFNVDSNTDLAVVNNSGNVLNVLLGNGDGSFGSPKSYTVGNGVWNVAAGDFNNDGKIDLVTANDVDNTVPIESACSRGFMSEALRRTRFGNCFGSLTG